MTDYGRSRAKSDKKNDRGNSRGLSSSKSRRSGGGGGRQAQKFDPSLFIKKVEERTAAELYTPKHAFTDFPIEQYLKNNILKKLNMIE